MASKRVTDLPAIAVPAESDILMAVQAGANGQVTVDNVVRSTGGIEFTGGAVVLNIAIAATWYDLTGWTTVKTRGSCSGSIAVPPGIDPGRVGPYLVHYTFSGLHAGGAGQALDFRLLDEGGVQISQVSTTTITGGVVDVSGVCWLDVAAVPVVNRIRLQVAQIGGTGNLTQYEGRLYAVAL